MSVHILQLGPTKQPTFRTHPYKGWWGDCESYHTLLLLCFAAIIHVGNISGERSEDNQPQNNDNLRVKDGPSCPIWTIYNFKVIFSSIWSDFSKYKEHKHAQAHFQTSENRFPQLSLYNINILQFKSHQLLYAKHVPLL